MSSPVIETQRLLLRRFTESDLEALAAILADEATNEFLPWYPPASRADVLRFYQDRYASQLGLPQACAYAICTKSSNVPIGYIKVSADDSRDLGYGLLSSEWRKGFASEAARAVVAQAARDGIPYVTATHDANNPRSGAVMRRIGMTYRYSYEELWQPKNVLVTFRMYQLDLVDPPHPTYTAYWEAADRRFVEPGLL